MIKKTYKLLLIAFSFILLFQVPLKSEAYTIKEKQFHWGLETWQMGEQVFQIHFNETSPVKIKKITGHLTAGPQPNHKAVDTLIRQTLVNLTYPGNSLPSNAITITKTPTERFNNGVDNNFLSLNVKQTGAETIDKPINVVYDQPIELPNNDLQFHIFNESYRYSPEQGSFISKDQFDALNVEIHVFIEYEVSTD